MRGEQGTPRGRPLRSLWKRLRKMIRSRDPLRTEWAALCMSLGEYSTCICMVRMFRSFGEKILFEKSKPLCVCVCRYSVDYVCIWAYLQGQSRLCFCSFCMWIFLFGCVRMCERVYRCHSLRYVFVLLFVVSVSRVIWYFIWNIHSMYFKCMCMCI